MIGVPHDKLVTSSPHTDLPLAKESYFPCDRLLMVLWAPG